MSILISQSILISYIVATDKPIYIKNTIWNNFYWQVYVHYYKNVIFTFLKNVHFFNREVKNKSGCIFIVTCENFDTLGVLFRIRTPKANFRHPKFTQINFETHKFCLLSHRHGAFAFNSSSPPFSPRLVDPLSLVSSYVWFPISAPLSP